MLQPKTARASSTSPPATGIEDYMSGQEYGLAVYSPVKDDGCYDNTVPEWLRGKNVLKVDQEIIDHLNKMVPS